MFFNYSVTHKGRNNAKIFFWRGAQIRLWKGRVSFSNLRCFVHFFNLKPFCLLNWNYFLKIVLQLRGLSGWLSEEFWWGVIEGWRCVEKNFGCEFWQRIWKFANFPFKICITKSFITMTFQLQFSFTFPSKIHKRSQTHDYSRNWLNFGCPKGNQSLP